MKSIKTIEGQLSKLDRSHKYYVEMHEERIRKLAIAYEKKKAALQEELNQAIKAKNELMIKNAKKI